MSETITTILVPVDFSPHADRALKYAAMLAQRLSAGLELVHVVENPFITGAWSAEAYLPNAGELLEGLIANAEQRLATLGQPAAALGVAAKTAVLSGRPAQAIVEHAKAGGFDLIVMGTHGRTGLSHVMMGSVAEGVIRNAPCPVFTVHATDGAKAAEASAAA
jgi:nucleotide-binding universal stress UspA family protein